MPCTVVGGPASREIRSVSVVRTTAALLAVGPVAHQIDADDDAARVEAKERIADRDAVLLG